jgi:hypothetical protein
MPTYGSPKAPEESASEQQDITGPEDSAAQKLSAPAYIAPRTPTLQVETNLDSGSQHGAPQATRTAPPRRGQHRNAAAA